MIATLLHELGGHAGFQQMMPKAQYDELMKQFDKLVQAKNPVAVQAKRLAEREQNVERQQLEYLPYLLTLASIQQTKNVIHRNALQRMMDKVLSVIKVFVFEKLGANLNLNEHDILLLAERMLESSLQQHTQSTEPLYQVLADAKSRLENGDIQVDSIVRQAQVLQGEPVVMIDESKLAMPMTGGYKAIIDWSNTLFQSWGNKVYNPVLGEVIVNEQSIRDSISHDKKLNPYKNLALAGIKDVLEQGALIHADYNTQGEDSFYIAAPVAINGNKNIVTVLVHRDVNTQRMYLHYVGLVDKLMQSHYNMTVAQDNTSRKHNRSATALDIVNILHRALTYKVDSVNSDNILYSRRAIFDSAIERLNQHFSAPETVSWWHKSVGTMYNLAQRSPVFKPVFDLAQRYIDDVSFYASLSAEQAPQILPRLDSWQDIFKTSAISAQDNKAISRPIFEGTLKYTRDNNGQPVITQDVDSAGIVWSDTELKQMFNLSDKQISLYHEFRNAINHSLDSMTRAEMLRLLGKDSTQVLRDEIMQMDNVADAYQRLQQYVQQLKQATPQRTQYFDDVLHDIENVLNVLWTLKRKVMLL